MIRFKISNDEQKFKDEYWEAQKNNRPVTCWNFNYHLVHNFNNLELKYLLFAFKNPYYQQSGTYNNLLYRMSNSFGDFLFKKHKIQFPIRFLVDLHQGYYLLGQYDENFEYYYNSSSVNNVLCFILHLDDKELRYDEDYFDLKTLTAKKVAGAIPFKISLSLVKRKINLLQEKLYSIMLIDRLK